MEFPESFESFENISEINTEDEETKSILYMNSDHDRMDQFEFDHMGYP